MKFGRISTMERVGVVQITSPSRVHPRSGAYLSRNAFINGESRILFWKSRKLINQKWKLLASTSTIVVKPISLSRDTPRATIEFPLLSGVIKSKGKRKWGKYETCEPQLVVVLRDFDLVAALKALPLLPSPTHCLNLTRNVARSDEFGKNSIIYVLNMTFNKEVIFLL